MLLEGHREAKVPRGKERNLKAILHRKKGREMTKRLKNKEASQVLARGDAFCSDRRKKSRPGKR